MTDTHRGITLTDVRIAKLTKDDPPVYRIVGFVEPPGKSAFYDFTPSKFLLANEPALEAHAKDLLTNWVRMKLDG
jgi:hypothetical protein